MLNYTTYNHKTAKDWVTFVHGAGGSSSIWFKQIRSFSSVFNVLVLDLRGHGNSQHVLKEAFNEKYTFDSITHDIVEVIDHLNIKVSHFTGISLGTILIRNLAEKHPERVKSMIMGGAIMKLNLKSQLLMRVGVFFKSVVPYLVLYKLFAFIIMPRKNHKKSRLIFVNEAKKYIGVPYVWGGDNPSKGFDCSGYVQWVINESINILLPRTSYQQSLFLSEHQRTNFEKIIPGDILFFNTSGGTDISHVGIAIGDFKFIHAPNKNSNIKIDNLDGYWKEKLVSANYIKNLK